MANLISGITFVNTYNSGLGYWGGWNPRISYNGSFVAFDTVPGVAEYVGYPGAQLPPFIDVSGTLMSSGAEHFYLKSMATGTLTVLDPVMIGDFGLDEAPGGSTTSISADGRYVAYQVTGLYDSGLSYTGANVDQVNIKNTSTGQIINPNTSAGGGAGNGDSLHGQLSETGRYVAFDSNSTNLVVGDGNGMRDVFLKDTVTGAITLVSATGAGTLGNGVSTALSVSSNGRFVLFETYATNLSDLASTVDVLIKDLQTGAIASLGAANLGAKNASMTPDGRYVVFDIDTFDSFGQVYRYDTVTGNTVLVSTGANGAGNDDSKEASISANGRYVVFESWASNFVANDTNGFDTDIFVKDLVTGAIARLNVSAAGAQALGGTSSTEAQISGDGHYVVFRSGSPNLVAGDINGNVDVFMTLNPLWVQPAITGTEAANNLMGTAGDDLMRGLGGNDTLNGGLGNDTMQGGAGNDVYVRNAAGDVVTELVGQGNDLVQSAVTYALGANLERLTLTGAGNINGTGNVLTNILTGNTGNNVMNGGGGVDTLRGMGGNDTLVWSAQDMLFDGGTGIDTLKVNAGNLNLTAIDNTKILNVETINLTGGGNNLLALDTQDVLALSSTTNALKVLGDAGDTINIVGAFTDQGISAGFHRYTFGGATLLVDLDITNVA